MISELRTELLTAVHGGAGQPLLFELGPVELEVTVAVERTAGANAKIRFWVAELGAEGALANSSTQRIKLTLQPRVAATGAVPFVSDDQVEGED